jgi:uncharacterized membrane protein YtjA (UPF0391 family)
MSAVDAKAAPQKRAGVSWSAVFILIAVASAVLGLAALFGGVAGAAAVVKVSFGILTLLFVTTVMLGLFLG